MAESTIKFRLYFSSKTDKEFYLDFITYESDIAKRWFHCLKNQCEEIDSEIKEPDRLYNFPNDGWDEKRMINELNLCIKYINSSKEVIKHRAYCGMSQEHLNILHHYFEILRGGTLSVAEYYSSATPKQQFALDRYNVLIHRLENYYRNDKLMYIAPRIVCTFNNRIRHNLLDDDYTYFTFLRNFGEVYINYCEVGKPLFDLFKDGDDVAGEDNIRPLRFYSADFTVYFHDRSQESVDSFLSDMSKWWDRNDNYLSSLGFRKDDPKNALGNIPVAKLINSFDHETLVLQLSECSMKKVMII